MSLPNVDKLSIISLEPTHIDACSSIEARAFNVLRKKWGEPLQLPRNKSWLLYYSQNYCPFCRVALMDDEVIGYGLVHVWGSLGWIGPIAVELNWQGHGVGRMLTRWGWQVLDEQNCQTISLETWSHNTTNIGLYIKAGFYPGPLVIVLEKKLTEASGSFSGQRLSESSQQEILLEGLKNLSGKIATGLDYRPLLTTTLDCRLGEVYVWGGVENPYAFAVIHYASHAEAPPPEFANVELLLVQPGEEPLLESLLAELEGEVAASGQQEIRISLAKTHEDGLHRLLRLGYRLRKTRLRMYAKEQTIPPEMINYLSYVV